MNALREEWANAQCGLCLMLILLQVRVTRVFLLAGLTCTGAHRCQTDVAGAAHMPVLDQKGERHTETCIVHLRTTVTYTTTSV